MNRRSHRPAGAILGRHKVVDDRTGFVVLDDAVDKEWNGLRVVEVEPRHPQEYVRGVKDDQLVKNARPPAPTEGTLATGSNFGAAVSGSLTLLTVDMTETKQVSRLDLTITDAILNDYRRFLRLETSTDAVSYTAVDDPIIDGLLAAMISGTAVGIPLGGQYRAIRVIADPPGTVAFNHTTAMTIYGGSVYTPS